VDEEDMIDTQDEEKMEVRKSAGSGVLLGSREITFREF
jgi:hypothetical protein